MHYQSRIKKLEKGQGAMLQLLSDDALRSIARTNDTTVVQWLRTLSDDDLIVLRDDLPGAAQLIQNFYDYQAK